MSTGYLTVGTLGGLVGVNIAAYTENIDIRENPIFGNHTSEAVALIFVLGIIWDLLPAKYKFNAFLIAPLAAIAGYVWEPFTFLSFGNKEAFEKVISNWTYYGVPTAFIIGLPVLLFSNFMRTQRKIAGINTTHSTGLIITFIGAAIIAYLIFKIMWEQKIYNKWIELVRENT